MVAAWTGSQNSKPNCDRACRRGLESGVFRSKKRVLVNALLGKSESMDAPCVFIAFVPPFLLSRVV